uniref:AMP-dependent synthetase/ligase domain-containing protein n=1 Tax=Panagrolaimus sp. JU765 TaxID=591449 RepID=A0AC34Q788_9BILA
MFSLLCFSHIIRRDSLADQLIFKKIQEGLGGSVRLMLTGSAPCADIVLTFMRCALGAVIIEGYGQTECVACATITLEGDCVPGHVGVPSPCNAFKDIYLCSEQFSIENGKPYYDPKNLTNCKAYGIKLSSGGC